MVFIVYNNLTKYNNLCILIHPSQQIIHIFLSSSLQSSTRPEQSSIFSRNGILWFFSDFSDFSNFLQGCYFYEELHKKWIRLQLIYTHLMPKCKGATIFNNICDVTLKSSATPPMSDRPKSSFFFY